MKRTKNKKYSKKSNYKRNKETLLGVNVNLKRR